MEYSKEDLMEAKKQILGVGENMGTEESKKIWEENAQFWDNAMGDESNESHREVVRPKVTELLSPNPADYILDKPVKKSFGIADRVRGSPLVLYGFGYIWGRFLSLLFLPFHRLAFPA